MWMSAFLFALLGTGVYSHQTVPDTGSTQFLIPTAGQNTGSTQISTQTKENLALRGRSVQSSTDFDWVAAHAIDSITLDSCTHTDKSNNPWWRLDLLKSYPISRVIVTNRAGWCADRLDGAEIHIGNSLENNGNNNPRCAVLNAVSLGESVSVSCDMEGRYVNVFLPGTSKILTLCEVEVYEADYMKKAFVMMKFVSSVNVTDPAVSSELLNQVTTVLTSKGLSNFTLTWTKPPQDVKQDGM
ncbi:fucolectin-like [Triplophysa rosa]|uniref:Fucolectin-like n=1 Tax=Triplophysa rosa TaxID=992332 RepID=A0A9W7X4W2_TRIRA|nr:fucolectin-like [Triplophysa rosa]KAI7814162.1 putative fucolectin-like [Triplophysa rosa]